MGLAIQEYSAMNNIILSILVSVIVSSGLTWCLLADKIAARYNDSCHPVVSVQAIDVMFADPERYRPCIVSHE